MVGRKSPRDETKRSNVAERANVEEGSPSQAVDQPETDKSENEIGDADPDGLQQGGFCGEARQFKDSRREIQNCVDSGHLVEECNQDGEQDRFAKAARPEMSGGTLLGGGGENCVCLGCDFGWRSLGFDPLQHLHTSIAIAPSA